MSGFMDRIPLFTDVNRRLELPASAYMALNERPQNWESSVSLPKRPNFNTQGKKAMVNVNQFKIASWPRNPIAQFDITVTPGSGLIEDYDPKRFTDSLRRKLWDCPPVKEYRLKNYDSRWIYDGKKIAWNKTGMKTNNQGRKEYIVRVDLDVAYGKPSRTTRLIDGKPDLSNCFCVTFRQTTEIKMHVIGAFLKQETDFTNDVFEAINFLDHVLRETPSGKYTQIKRSFFTWDDTLSKQDIQNKMMVAKHIEFMRGVYASVRLCHMSSPTATGLAVNLDVANGLFWAPMQLHSLCREWCYWKLDDDQLVADYEQFGRDLMPKEYFPPLDKMAKDKNGKRLFTEPKFLLSKYFLELRKFIKLKVTLKHKGKNDPMSKQVYVIKDWPCTPEQFLNGGPNSKNTFFDWKEKNKRICIYDYMLERYNHRLKYWRLPMIQTAKAGLFPMELCQVMPQQRFPFKLDGPQTANMIKHAVQRPKQRLESINHGLRMLDWDADPMLQHFGIKIDKNMTTTEARVLKNPTIQYGGGKKIDPGLTGRWNIQNTKFLKPNTEPLVSWGICAMNNCLDSNTIKNFISRFCSIYASHGGVIQSKYPVIVEHFEKEDIPSVAARLYKATGDKFNLRPQILLWVLPDTNSDRYARMKKNMECRFAIVSQMLRKEQVQKCSPQYCSNVCMKFNAKLGGTTNRIAGQEKDGSHSWFKRPTMVLGADVTHPTAQSKQASMCALTMSADRGAGRYWAICETNGYNVEMIQGHNIRSCLMRLFPKWIQEVGGGKGPEHIYYFRDGVSEGQYEQVLQEEVKAMKAALKAKWPQAASIKFTVVICGKRHKIRFFPKDNWATDKNGNAIPGTLVERDVTHPFEHDFYLSSHSAIQGTAKPTHYAVILDEAQVPVNDLHKMIYEHCYQYMRSTTPVSLYPAVYYAHLAAARCRAHENLPSGTEEDAGPRHGQKFEEQLQDQYLDKLVKKFVPLSKMEPEKMTPQQKADYKIEVFQEQNKHAIPLQALGSGMTNFPQVVDRIVHSMWYI